MNNTPILFKKKSECCGCFACYSVCNAGAIKMVTDEEGFKYPEIDASICIRCMMCKSICPIKK